MAALPGMVVGAYEDKSFASPEEALNYFVEEMRACDLEGALEAFPVVRAAENFDFDKYLDRLQGWAPSDIMNYPSTCELYKNLNQSKFVSKILSYVCNFTLFLCSDDIFLDGNAIMIEEMDIPGLMEAAAEETSQIADLELVRMDYYDPEIQDGEGMQESWKEQAALYGGDGFAQYFVQYRMGDTLYLGGATFIRYGEEYYLWELDCTLSGIRLEGAVMAVTEEEYNNIVLTH